MAKVPNFVCVTYIEATPEAVWRALTDAGMTAEYWGHSNVSNWNVGDRWEHVRTDGSGIADVVGTVVESQPPTRLVITFGGPSDDAHKPTIVAFDIERYKQIVKLTVTQTDFADLADYEASATGWPAVLANLKTLLECGHALPQPPWEMHAELRDAQLVKNNPR